MRVVGRGSETFWGQMQNEFGVLALANGTTIFTSWADTRFAAPARVVAAVARAGPRRGFAIASVCV
eukprot:6767405-Pyramimonas_sp.AAC.1